MSVKSATLDGFGLRHDRRWMVVDAESGSFLTQRQLPRLALLQPEVLRDGEALRVTNRPDGRVVEVPLVTVADGGKVVPVRVWGEDLRAVHQGAAAAEWFTDVLDMQADGPVALVYMDASLRRKQMSSWHVPKPAGGAAVPDVSFADGFPFLLATEESLEDLNARIAGAEPDMPMNRFRPNIVTRGSATPWEEDSWAELDIGAAQFFGVKRCMRCRIPTTNQDTGEQGTMTSEPLRTLGTFRKAEGKVLFGHNLVHTPASIGAAVSVGDVVFVNKRLADIGPK